MGRYDHADTSHMCIKNQNVTLVTCYFSDGIVMTITSEEEIDKKEVICAKKVSWHDNKDQNTTYYILCNNHNQMFDPRSNEPLYKKRNWKYRMVNQKTFNLYVRFLDEKYNRLLLQAERLL